MQNDRFADIAQSFAQKDEKGLVTPQPLLNKAELLKLDEYNGEHEFQPCHKHSTKEELDIELEKLREAYQPFMRCFAPATHNIRKRQYLKEFDWRIETIEDKSSMCNAIDGIGEWEQITIPHYGEPVGSAVTYYRTEFSLDDEYFIAGGLYICFKGADYKAHVFMNGSYAGSHEGLFAPFEFDITSYAKKGINTLIVKLENDNIQMGCDDYFIDKILTGDKIYAATGPGWDDPEVGWHHCPPGMGIYQQVYVESRNRLHIQDIFVRPLNTDGDAEVWIDVTFMDSDAVDVEFDFSVYGKNFEHTEFEHIKHIPEVIYNGKTKRLQAEKGYNRFIIPFKIDTPRLWDTQNPWMYSINIALLSDGKQADAAQRNFGVRIFEQDTDSEPKGMFSLNGKPVRLRGANTMGFEQQAVMKEDFDRLRDDILLAKLCNMNFLRITQRPVQPEVYDFCDMLGLLIQTDLPMFGTVRINQYCEVIRQAGEMERLIRSHPCCILSTYINEPFWNCYGMPHRQIDRKSMSFLFDAADGAMRLHNPDRVIKHVDGDYDPPANSMPDNHCYCMWYNGHGIDIGKLLKGYWQKVLNGWYYGCGEFGAEGLDFTNVMRKYYPEKWLPQNEEDEKSWSPSNIARAQTGRMHRFFFDTPTTLEEWVERSQEHQAFANKIMTEAFRRDNRMVSFAIHLFIDAFPAGWMKTIMDCDRNPKKSYFAYRAALSPVLASLRSDRLTCFSGEKLNIEAWICNDTSERINTIMRCVVENGGEKLYSVEKKTEIAKCTSEMHWKLVFDAPEVNNRSEMIIKMGLMHENNNTINDTSLTIEVFPQIPSVSTKVCVLGKEANQLLERSGFVQTEINEAQVILISDIESYNLNVETIEKKVKVDGAKVIFLCLEPGEYTLFGADIIVKKSSPLHFISRNTQHKLAGGYREFDFRFWYNDDKDMITPIAETTFTSAQMTPVLLGGGEDDWENVAAEMPCGKGSVILCQVLLAEHIKNPVVADFLHRLLK